MGELSGAQAQNDAGAMDNAFGGGFANLFKQFAIDVLLASGSVSQACELLGIDWDAAQKIINGGVKRRLGGENCMV